MREIVVLHENEEWLVPLREAFKARGVVAKEWFLDSGIVPYTETPEDAVYYNRMSASSHTRGHRFAPELTKSVLTWLESKNRTVVNGSQVLALEICKLSQYAALERAGLKVPKTHAVVGKQHLVEAAQRFAQWPLIVKPNRGGKGLGVQRIDSIEQLQQYVQRDDLEEPLDGTWLLQEYIQPKQPFITRAEFVGQKFVYAVQVNTEDGFELCPADNCSIEAAFCPTDQQSHKFTITKRFNDHEIIVALENFLRSNDIDVAGIEFIEDERGDLFVYDVNTNTNYNQPAEQRAKVKNTGMGALADYLIRLAQ
ncbi:alpha-L-glutamate ligase [Idiomarina sp. OT37-5b]|jgi:glutathione synthase/RimK-type ligase-like ATP-grasp enzyme|uniref:Alpha-L-glutamate ligase n=1 Tax=Idiomarina aquatica TaxID=1327752 RepID=A0AA94ED09_9GAMM|nr:MULTISPECIES: alpha-L-glutamate ligase [Idiomarina]AVJ57014.1 alpha-L-glutamate ligase [Idiomarina sp. OT37-5b]RUO40261.1 alpha-L-glutamate ligase [Idiomarina aquatica]